MASSSEDFLALSDSIAARYLVDLYTRSSHLRSTQDRSSIGRVHCTQSKGSAQGLDSTPTSTLDSTPTSIFAPAASGLTPSTPVDDTFKASVEID